MSTAILLDKATCRYRGGVTAFADLSLSVARGEVFGLLGNNGAGKSSLIKILCGLLRPSAGTVRVLGIDVVGDPVAVKGRIGVMPQENNLDTFLDVRRNLLFHCRYFGLGARESAARVDRWLDLLGLADKAGESVLTLSGGTRRKVMLAKAFLTEPELLILDEPTTGLDPEVREFVWQRITAFRAAGSTVFLSTHYLEEAERLCDRVAIIHRGAIAALGPVGELTADADGEVARTRGLGEVFRSAVGSLS
jgi:ABC-type multidrug transport system ATPase subunit